jgi:hypothetical protein
MSPDEIVAVNLIPMRPGVPVADFARFSNEVDRPTCLAKDVVLGFDAYVVERRDPGAPSVDVVELMHVRSWDEWVAVRDHDPDLEPVTRGFTRHVDPATVRTLFARPLR